jgi:hypothetical protein
LSEGDQLLTMAAGQSGFRPTVGLVPAPPVLGGATSRVSGGVLVGLAGGSGAAVAASTSGLGLSQGLRLRLRGWALAVLARARPWAQAQK